MIVEVVPGASVCPTLARLDITQAGYAALCCTPLPERVTVAGEFVALLLAVTLPVMLPVAEGAKLTLKVAFCPGVRTVPVETPLTLKPAPDTLTPEIATLELPEFVRVTGRVLLVPVFTFPKFKFVGLALSRYVAAFTVSVAVLLVTLPVELLTTTLNCPPLSAVFVAGVV